MSKTIKEQVVRLSRELFLEMSRCDFDDQIEEAYRPLIEEALQERDRIAREEEREHWFDEMKWLYHYLVTEPNEDAVKSILNEAEKALTQPDNQDSV